MAATTADEKPCEERGPFTGCAAGGMSLPKKVVSQLLLVLHVFLPRDVSGMRTVDPHRPFLGIATVGTDHPDLAIS